MSFEKLPNGKNFAGIWEGRHPGNSFLWLKDFLYELNLLLPHGTTAKLEAIAAGETPPGWNPQHISERLDSKTNHSWVCHAVASMGAHILNEHGVTSQVDLLRRVDAAAPPVDLHSVIIVKTKKGQILVDPYHMAGPVPMTAGAITSVNHTLLDYRNPKYVLSPQTKERTKTLSYQLLARNVSDGDLKAVCEISSVFSGIPAGWRASIMHPTHFSLAESSDGTLWTIRIVPFGEQLQLTDVVSRDEAFHLIRKDNLGFLHDRLMGIPY